MKRSPQLVDVSVGAVVIQVDEVPDVGEILRMLRRSWPSLFVSLYAPAAASNGIEAVHHLPSRVSSG